VIITLDEAKQYLRIDGDGDDNAVTAILQSAQNICMDVARIDDEAEFLAAGDVAKEAVLYTLGYFYEHREDADQHSLVLKLRSLLFGVRKPAF
jgi:hypothetical protein